MQNSIYNEVGHPWNGLYLHEIRVVIKLASWSLIEISKHLHPDESSKDRHTHRASSARRLRVPKNPTIQSSSSRHLQTPGSYPHLTELCRLPRYRSTTGTVILVEGTHWGSLTGRASPLTSSASSLGWCTSAYCQKSRKFCDFSDAAVRKPSGARGAFPGFCLCHQEYYTT